MTLQTANAIKFSLGNIVITSNAQSILSSDEVMSALARHARGDWGDLTPEDAERNVEALHEGSRIFSAYGEGPRRFWIITDADQASTTVLMPSDY